MTDDTRKNVYLKDVEKFYASFTGEPFLPNDVAIIITGLNTVSQEQVGDFFQPTYGYVEKVEKRPNGDFMVRFGDPKSDNKRKKDKGNKAQKKAIALTEVLGQPVSVKKFEVFSFAQIPLKDFHNQDLCKDPESPWHKSYKGPQSDKLFNEYAQHLKKMITDSQAIEKSLLTIIKDVFSFWVDPKKQEKKLTLNPQLTKDKLKELVEKTREAVIKLYIGCENDFQKGLSIFEAIITQKMMDTAQRRINKFQDKANTLKGDVDDESTEKKEPSGPEEPEKAAEPVEDMSDFNKPKIIQSEDTGPVKPAEPQINQNININIQQPEPAAAPIAGGTRKRRKRKKRRKTSKRR